MIRLLTWTVGLAVLWLGAWLDWRGRSVPNKIWVYALAALAPVLLVEAWTDTAGFLWRLAATIPAAMAGFTLWLGRGMGAADAKAIMVGGLCLSPVGYWNPDLASFIPILDALATGLILAEAWRRLGRMQGTPFLVVLAPLATLSLVAGGLLWWPFVWLARIIH